MRIRNILFYVLMIIGFVMPMMAFATGTGTIDPANRISWLCTSEAGNTDCHDHTLVNWNVIPAVPNLSPVIVGDSLLTGYVFSSQIGWIHLSPTDPTQSWGSGASAGHGVVNDNAGNLSGYAWGSVGSWVNFNPTHAGVHIDVSTGNFSGYAWIQNHGWMLFDCSHAPDASSTVPCVRTTWTPDSDATSTATTTDSGGGGGGGGGGTTIYDPVANPIAGTYTSIQHVTITSTSSTFIKYTTNTALALSCSNGSSYVGAITVATSQTIKAIGCDSNGNHSNVVLFDYIINIPTVGAPVADPIAGTYTSIQYVTLSSASSTSIRYTDDGTTPTCSVGNLYSDTTPIDVSSSVTIRAIGCNGSVHSVVSTFVYVIHILVVGTPIATPPAGTYSTAQSVTLSSTNATSIRYTNDGSIPTCSSGTVYSTPIDIYYSETIKAIGCNGSVHSAVATFNYTINIETVITGTGTTTATTTTTGGSGTISVYPPQSSLRPGTYSAEQFVTLSSTNATSIRYTEDGSIPTCSSGILYTGAIDVFESETINAIGCNGTASSAVSNFVYIINPITATTTTIKVVEVVFGTTQKQVAKTFSSPKNAEKIKVITTTGIVAGTAVSVVSNIFLSSFSLGDILLIPIRLWSLLLAALGLAKRKKPWGTVYDSVTKQPLDPAYVVLKSMEGVDVATAITDLDGRYGFVAPEPGNYSLFVHKTNYLFPSQKLVGQDHDELYRDLYFGEHFSITASGEFIAKNVPMDPEKFDWNEFAKKSQHLMKFYSNREKWFSRIANFFFVIGFMVSFLALVYSFTRGNMVIFAMYIFLFFVRTFGLRSRPFGNIVWKESGKPIPFAIIRISQASTNIEVMHRVTDKIGRYYCLLPNGDYFIRIDHKLPDGSYKEIVEKIPVTVTKGYLSKEFVVSSANITENNSGTVTINIPKIDTLKNGTAPEIISIEKPFVAPAPVVAPVVTPNPVIASPAPIVTPSIPASEIKPEIKKDTTIDSVKENAPQILVIKKKNNQTYKKYVYKKKVIHTPVLEDNDEFGE
ncbi:MAG: chitobiase/beta-hexosaminidase C-terminal domain-containing protein [bacterium]